MKGAVITLSVHIAADNGYDIVNTSGQILADRACARLAMTNCEHAGCICILPPESWQNNQQHNISLPIVCCAIS